MLDGALVKETQKLNNLMVLLTIAISGGPFLGLLGTVIGVMITFAAIARTGAKAANPEIQTLNGYSQHFVDQAKCKEIALDQIAKKSDIIFQVAGGCGLGALDAAK